MNSWEELAEKCESMVKNVNIRKEFCGEDYDVLVDVSKAGKLQRALEWAGLKPVSSQVIWITGNVFRT